MHISPGSYKHFWKFNNLVSSSIYFSFQYVSNPFVDLYIIMYIDAYTHTYAYIFNNISSGV